jgi:hypothetical protein
MTGSFGSSAVITLNSGSTVEFNGTTVQYAEANYTMANVIIANPGGVVQNGEVTINGDLLLTNGTMTPGANKLNIKGNIVRTGGAINAANTEVVFNGTSAQKVAAGTFTGSVRRININNLGGVTFESDATVTEAINLTAGKLDIGNQKLTIRGALSRNGSTELGTIDAQAGSVEFDGTTTQAVPQGAFQNNKVKACAFPTSRPMAYRSTVLWI